jgi:hypothetical protein
MLASTTRAMLLTLSSMLRKATKPFGFIEECAMTQIVTALYDTSDSAASAVDL